MHSSQIAKTWDSARTSLWFVPSILVVGAFAAAPLALWLEPSPSPDGFFWRLLIHQGDGADARNLLSTLLTSVITMASMAFSVTIVALTLASNSYGSRIIRVFRADLRTQFVLGLFAATIVYNLMILRSLRGAAEPDGVPQIAVTIATALALISVLALLAFIQVVAHSIVADKVIAGAIGDLEDTIKDLPLLKTDKKDPPFEAHVANGARIALPREGYVQAVDYEGMVDWAKKNEAVLTLDFRSGDFVVNGDRRIAVHPPREDIERIRSELRDHILSGSERTPTQDVKFSIRHLVEIALRALSSGINDPYTALAVIDRLRGAMSRLMERALPGRYLYDSSGTLRVVRKTISHADILDAAFHQIRQSGSATPAVLLHLLRAFRQIAEHASTPEQLERLSAHAELVFEDAQREIENASDRAQIEETYRETKEAIEGVRGEAR